jgi:predicted hotdog family 3-hydroxylacyl-ACP dehydratase
MTNDESNSNDPMTNGVVAPRGLAHSSFQNSDLIHHPSFVIRHSAPRLPHASPMHWLDTAELSPDGRVLTATRSMTPAHPFVREGHLLASAFIELMAQAAAAGAMIKAERRGKRIRRGVLAAISQMRVLAVAPPDGKIVIEAREEKSFGPFTSAHIRARAGGILLADARMTFHLAFE